VRTMKVEIETVIASIEPGAAPIDQPSVPEVPRVGSSA